ncbi:helix-turn-helix domain-containing protein [Glycocaulis sp.]
MRGRPGGWGQALRALRQRSNMKQEDAADRLQVSQSYISRLENGVITPSPDIAERLAKLLHNPVHRPLIDQLRSIVRHSPHAVALMVLNDGGIAVIEASQSFHNTGPQLHLAGGELGVGDSLEEKVERLVCRAVEAGAFEGAIACIEFVWRAHRDGRWRYFHSVQTPVFTGTQWLVHSATALLRAETYDRFVEENGGPERLHHF